MRWKRRRKVPLQFQSPSSAAGFLIDLTLSPVLGGQKLRNQQPKECPYAQQPALANRRFGFVLVVGFGVPQLCGVSIREFDHRLFVLLRPLRAPLDRHRRPSRQEVRTGLAQIFAGCERRYSGGILPIDARGMERVPLPSLPVIKSGLDVLSVQYPQAEQTDPNLIIDPTFVKRIEQSGFIDALTRNRYDQRRAVLRFPR